MFNKKIDKLEEMMVEFCEYNPIIFAQNKAIKKEKQTQKTFNYGNFSLSEYLKNFN